MARVAGAEAAIELAGTAEEHIAATKVQAIQRDRVTREQLAAKKAASAPKLADVDAKLAAEEGSENEAEEDLTWRRLRRARGGCRGAGGGRHQAVGDASRAIRARARREAARPEAGAKSR